MSTSLIPRSGESKVLTSHLSAAVGHVAAALNPDTQRSQNFALPCSAPSKYNERLQSGKSVQYGGGVSRDVGSPERLELEGELIWEGAS